MNNQGDVAWSQLATSTKLTQAMFYRDGASHFLPGSDDDFKMSTAVNLSEALSSSDNVWVVGSASTNNALLDRRAQPWSIPAANDLPVGIAVLDLGAATPQPASGQAGPVKSPQQSYAYGIARSGSSLFVVGSAREYVRADSLPQPILWRVSTSSAMSVSSAQLLPLPTYTNIPANDDPNTSLSGTYTNGVVRDIAARPEGGYWACGNVAAPRIYSEAYCWQLDANGNASSPIAVNIGTRPLATSMVSRVRTLPIGQGGAEQSVVIGSSLGTDGTWRGWAYNLSTKQRISDDFSFSPDMDAMAHDAAGIVYEGTSGLAYGLMVGGISASMSVFNDGTLPVSVPLRGIERKMLLAGIVENGRDDGQVCAIDDDSPLSAGGAYDQVVAMSRDGQFRLARAGTELVQLSASAKAHDVQLVARNAYVRTHESQNPASNLGGTALSPSPRIYYEAEIAASEVDNATRAALRLSNQVGCGSAALEPGLDACSNQSQAAFDLRDNGLRIPMESDTAGQPLRSARIYEQLLPNSYQFAQVASRTSQSSCSITPVLPASTVISYNPALDLDGTSWNDCYPDSSFSAMHLQGHDTNVRESYDHCGTCNASANDNLGACTINHCSNGTPHSVTTGSGCWVESANQQWKTGRCAATGQEIDQSIANDAHNKCRICTPSANHVGWTKPDEFYRCIAHHDSSAYNARENGNRADCEHWGFFGGSVCEFLSYKAGTNNVPGAPTPKFNLRTYRGNHMCARADWDDQPSRTRNGTNKAYWADRNDPDSLTASPGSGPPVLDTPVWPDTFRNLPSLAGEERYFNAVETRRWIFKHRIRYLGIMNPESPEKPAAGQTFYPGWEASAVYLKPGEEEWLVFYYNDHSEWQDRLGILAQFDGSLMDVQVDFSFVCGAYRSGKRLDGVRYCGAKADTNTDNRSRFNVTCTSQGSTAATRHSTCSADRWSNDLPWRSADSQFFNPNGPDAALNASWNAQGGIYLDGHLDCGKRPQDSYSNHRQGWAVIRIKRKVSTNPAKNRDDVCTPITVRQTMWHANNSHYTVCW